jgi:transcriptional regulator with XRE-family HTH domain
MTNCKSQIANIMKKGTFDAEAFFSALDAVRLSRKITWKKIAADSGVSASTLTRMAQGKRPDVDSLAALVTWSGLNSDDFIRGDDSARVAPETLAVISTHLKADPNLNRESAIALEELIKATYERLREREP